MEGGGDCVNTGEVKIVSLCFLVTSVKIKMLKI